MTNGKIYTCLSLVILSYDVMFLVPLYAVPKYCSCTLHIKYNNTPEIYYCVIEGQTWKLIKKLRHFWHTLILFVFVSSTVWYQIFDFIDVVILVLYSLHTFIVGIFPSSWYHMYVLLSMVLKSIPTHKCTFKYLAHENSIVYRTLPRPVIDPEIYILQ